MVDTVSPSLSEGTRLGRYTLLRRIATGGMAEVWLARASGVQGFTKDIVVKTILPHHAEDPQFVRMFVNEALLAADLNHPNIVQIFDLGRFGRSYYIAMEYISGRTLRQVKRECAKRKSRPPSWFVLKVAVAVCDALDHAHGQCGEDGQPLGIIHRDVTPENIMIAFSGATKVLDFGIAKASGLATNTEVGQLKGKFAYIAPEQITGAAQGERPSAGVDIYALGVVLYELLTGARPFPAKNNLALLKAILEEDPLAPSARDATIPQELSDIVMKSLVKDPSKRYQSAHDLRNDLEAFVAANKLSRSERAVGTYLRELFGVATSKATPKGTVAAVSEANGAPGVAGAGADSIDVTIELVEDGLGTRGASPPKGPAATLGDEEPTATASRPAAPPKSAPGVAGAEASGAAAQPPPPPPPAPPPKAAAVSDAGTQEPKPGADAAKPKATPAKGGLPRATAVAKPARAVAPAAPEVAAAEPAKPDVAAVAAHASEAADSSRRFPRATESARFPKATAQQRAAEAAVPAAPPSGSGSADERTGDEDQRSDPTPWDTVIRRTRSGSDPGAGPEPEPPTPRLEQSGSRRLSERARDDEAPPKGARKPQGAAEDSTRHMWDAVLGRVPPKAEPKVEPKAKPTDHAFAQGEDPMPANELQASIKFDEGLALLRDGDREGARRAWEIAVEMAPDNRRYRVNLRRLEQMTDEAGNGN